LKNKEFVVQVNIPGVIIFFVCDVPGIQDVSFSANINFAMRFDNNIYDYNKMPGIISKITGIQESLIRVVELVDPPEEIEIQTIGSPVGRPLRSFIGQAVQ
jgi:hypothetical protein